MVVGLGIMHLRVNGNVGEGIHSTCNLKPLIISVNYKEHFKQHDKKSMLQRTLLLLISMTKIFKTT